MANPDTRFSRNDSNATDELGLEDQHNDRYTKIEGDNDGGNDVGFGRWIRERYKEEGLGEGKSESGRTETDSDQGWVDRRSSQKRFRVQDSDGRRLSEEVAEQLKDSAG